MQLKYPYANPGAFGLAGFGLTTLCLCVYTTELMPARTAGIVLPLALAYGGLAQFLAGMWAMARGDTFAATAFTSYGGFWLSIWALEFWILPGMATNPLVSADDIRNAVALFDCMWCIFTLYLWVASYWTERMIFAVFSGLGPTLIFLTIGGFANSTTVTKIGGWLGIITAVTALYGSAGIVINDAWSRKILPLGIYEKPAPPMPHAV